MLPELRKWRRERVKLRTLPNMADRFFHSSLGALTHSSLISLSNSMVAFKLTDLIQSAWTSPLSANHNIYICVVSTTLAGQSEHSVDSTHGSDSLGSSFFQCKLSWNIWLDIVDKWQLGRMLSWGFLSLDRAGLYASRNALYPTKERRKEFKSRKRKLCLRDASRCWLK